MAGTEIPEGGVRGGCGILPQLHCHHQNDFFALQWAAMRATF